MCNRRAAYFSGSWTISGGNPAVVFTLQGVSGEKIFLRDYRWKKPVVVEPVQPLLYAIVVGPL
ncbi:MAG: hypothetical protein ACRERE_30470 [Candidatus Entotheonellia bacterium]